jgi:beta-lactamase class A
VIAGVLLFLAASQPADVLSKQIAEIAAAAAGNVGAAVAVIETGESVQFHGSDKFPMQSVYKLPIGMAVLDRVEHGSLKLEQRVRVEKADLVPTSLHSPIRDAHPDGTELSLQELLRSMVSESDGTACDVLLRLAGGPARVTAYLQGIGIHDVIVAAPEADMARDPKVQYRNSATPLAMIEVLRKLGPRHELLMRYMTETATAPNRIKGLLPPGTVVAHKTGSSGTRDGFTAATNDVGLVTLPDGRHMAVAVFVSDTRAETAVRDSVIAKIARAAWDRWAAPAR